MLNGLGAAQADRAGNALIFGAGPIGLLLGVGLKTKGVAAVTFVEIDGAWDDLGVEQAYDRLPTPEDGDSGEAPLDVTAEAGMGRAMHQALNIARAEGKVSDQVEETIRCTHARTLDWRTLLRRYMTDAARSDYSWSLPNRRFIDSGLYLPSIRSKGMETIAVIVGAFGATRQWAPDRRPVGSGANL